MKILLAVSHQDVRKALTAILQSMGNEVEPVECEADVLEILDNNGRTYEAVVTYLFPVMSVTDLLSLIKTDKRFSTMPVVVVCELDIMEKVTTRGGIFANEGFLPDSILAALAQVAAGLNPPATP